MKITAYKCKYTGKVFEDRSKYIKHLHRLRCNLRAAREEARVNAAWEEWIKAERAAIQYARDIPEWFLKNQKVIMAATNTQFSRDNRNRFVSDDVFTALSMDVDFFPLVSNSHACPANGKTNFMRLPELPTGYPGWTGRLTGSLKRPDTCDYWYPYGAALNKVGIHTHGGGGGNKFFGYNISIFLADWPGLQHEIDEAEQAAIVKRLIGKSK